MATVDNVTATEIEIPGQELIATELLDENPNNPNSMDPELFDSFCDVIKKIGFRQPIVCTPRDDRYLIIDGAHRLRAALRLGMPHVSAVVIEDVSQAEAMVELISANRHRGTMDLSRVGACLAELAEQGYDAEALRTTGLSVEEISSLIEAANMPASDLPDPADVPDMDPDPEPADKLYVLEISFATRADLNTAKKALKHAAGTSKDLSVGLLAVLGQTG